MLRIQSISKSYGAHNAVNEVSIHIPKGKIFGLLGPNGAGKSSLLRMITGITHPDSGEILFENEPFNLRKHSTFIGYMPEERGLYKKMKVIEQAIYLTQLKGFSKQEATEKVKSWFHRLDMESWERKKVEDLSKGMSQKLQFVTTVCHQPKLLILDEPFSGLDPVNTDIIKNEIFELAKGGTTIIFSTHRMEQVEEICDEIALIHQGNIVLSGDVNEIKQSKKENIYYLKLNQPLKAFHEKIIHQKENEYHLQLSHPSEANQILSQCISEGIQIVECREMLPSLHELFIKQVEGSAVRQFSKSN